MLQLLPSSHENLILLRASGKLTKEDYDRILPVLETKIKAHGKIKMYVETDHLELPALSALWEDIKFDVKHYTDFSHVAVVGEPEWLAASTKLVAPLVPAEIRVFKSQEKDVALNWLTGA